MRMAYTAATAVFVILFRSYNTCCVRRKDQGDRMKSVVAIIGVVLSLWSTCAEAQQKASPSADVQCQLNIADVKTTPGQADVTLELIWSKTRAPIDKGKVTVVFLFSPKPVSALGPDLLKMSRDYIFNLPTDDLFRWLSGLVITTSDGKTHDGALALFATQTESATDFRKSGKFTFPIPIQSANRFTGQPAIEGEGALYIAVFKEDDPALDQMKSTKYKQLSNVASKSVNLK